MQRLDVAAHRVEVLAFMHEVAVERGYLSSFMLACWRVQQHQLFQFAVSIQQHFGHRCLESHPALGADDGVTQDGCHGQYRTAPAMQLPAFR